MEKIFSNRKEKITRKRYILQVMTSQAVVHEMPVNVHSQEQLRRPHTHIGLQNVLSLTKSEQFLPCALYTVDLFHGEWMSLAFVVSAGVGKRKLLESWMFLYLPVFSSTPRILNKNYLKLLACYAASLSGYSMFFSGSPRVV